ncbi:MAG: glycoside hydrolase family 2 TIM barrel-domain containing protein [Clostridia bacterium]
MKKNYITLDKNWKFLKSDISNAYETNFDDTNWREVRVPHDYAIEGPFSPENDKHFKEVVADLIMKPIAHVGRTGGLPICEHAWYRKTITISKNAKHIFLEFDGVMNRCEVYVNGVSVGGRNYGYSSFSIDITDFVHEGENLLAVAVRPKPEQSRWYTGAGIFRNVRLVQKDEIYFPYNAGFIIPKANGKTGSVECNLDVCNFGQEYELHYSIFDKNGNAVKTAKVISNEENNVQLFKLNGYVNWNVYDSYLYTFEAKIVKDSKVIDSYSTKFGFRTIEFDPVRGMFLNNKKIKMQGVCMHHDLGALGVAVNKSTTKRQVEKLINIGVNAIRTAHNPASPELLEICDELGVMVLEEAFDEWTMQKTTNGYGTYFETDGVNDLITMIERDRNHPCIIMWSIGNEILEERERNGWEVTRLLSSACRNTDSTRHITAGFPQPWEALKNGLYEYVDVIGINYRPQMYKKIHIEYPQKAIYGSETASASSSRGEYYLPDGKLQLADKKRDNLQVNSIDFDFPKNGNDAEKEFAAQDRNDFICGEFVWTGFDYIGEPTPYRLEWPSRSSYFGIYDLAGLEKDRCYSYISKWTNKDVVHLFPHWNWSDGDILDMYCYSNFDEVELFVNGKSYGISVKDYKDEILRHRHVWKNVKFEQGQVTAVAVRKPEISHTIKTAGKAVEVVLTPEKSEITADGNELVYIVCTAFDKDGNISPKANFKLDFEVNGVGEYIASDAGDATSLRVFSEKYCELYNGKCVAIVRSLKNKTGEIVVNAKADGIKIEPCTVKSI